MKSGDESLFLEATEIKLLMAKKVYLIYTEMIVGYLIILRDNPAGRSKGISAV